MLHVHCAAPEVVAPIAQERRGPGRPQGTREMVEQRAEVPVRWLTTEEAARYLGVSRDHLCRLRERSQGPSYRKFGKLCIYDIADLDAFMKSLPRIVAGQPTTGA